MVKNNKGFTLVELLAVIVILAVILVIAVPSIMSTITESRKGALASSAKLIASSAETAYISNQTLGIEKDIRCEDVSNYTAEDYKSCDITFVDGKAQVTLVGQGKFDGMAVCGGTKEEAEVEEPINGKCPTPFEKDTWATIKAAVDAEKLGEVGATSKYKVGDTRPVDLVINNEKKTYTLRIANKTACDGTLASQTACGFVIEFADIISEQQMNSSGTNAKGWPVSAMRKYLNDLDSNDNTDGVIYNALVSAIGDIIIPTTVVSGHGYGDKTGELANNNFGSIDKVYLLSTKEVWGSVSSDDTASGDAITRQLDYYSEKGVSSSSYGDASKSSGWWLRSATISYDKKFYYVNTSGDWSRGNANYTNGVSPAFRLG